MQDISRKERERLAREEDILVAAEKIFSTMGVDGASMEEIAQAAQFTRKTVYQYFGSKEVLLSAVVLKGFKLLLSYLQQETGIPCSGYEKLRSMGRAYYRFYQDYTSFFGLMNYSARVKQLGGEAARSEFEKVDSALFQSVYKVIDDGKADGSIWTGVDTIMGTASVIFCLTGFFYQYSITGKSFTEHLSLDGDSFVQYTLDKLLETFRA
jgi:AcrR family transcriptional regulator